MATAYAYYESGKIVSALIRDDSNQYADVVAEAMESYDAADIDDYDTAATETGDTGEYYITWPSWLEAGIYTIQWVPQAAGAIAESDLPNRFAIDSYYWDGETLFNPIAARWRYGETSSVRRSTVDQYSIRWLQDGRPLTSGITNAQVAVTKRSDGSTVLAATSMTHIGDGAYRHDETSSRLAADEIYLVTFTATIGGATRTVDKWVAT